MIKFAFHISELLRESLQKAESLRRNILITPLSPKAHLQLTWEAMLNRVYYSLVLTNVSVTKEEVIKTLSQQGFFVFLTQKQKSLTKTEKEIIMCKRTYDYIKNSWLVSDKPITTKSLILLHSAVSNSESISRMSEVKTMLDYIQANVENPIISAAIAHIELLKIAPFRDKNEETALFLDNLLLYKYGHDLKGLLVPEEYWFEDKSSYTYHLNNFVKAENITLWIEYFAHGIVVALEKVHKKLITKHFETHLPASFWNLNDRQKAILAALDMPASTINNRKVQKLFRVSQITASRDLAKLALLGLLISRGKGRSITYSRA